MNEDQVYLEYILDCIDKIKDYSQGGKQEFFANSMISDAIIRRLQTLAESTQRLSEELKANIPDVDWRNISGFRNILVHDYLGGIDLLKMRNFFSSVSGAKNGVEDDYLSNSILVPWQSD